VTDRYRHRRTQGHSIHYTALTLRRAVKSIFHSCSRSLCLAVMQCRRVSSVSRRHRLSTYWDRQRRSGNRRTRTSQLASSFYRATLCCRRVSVSSSVRLSKAGIVSQRLDESSWFLAWRLLSTCHTLCYMEIWGSPKIRALPSGTLSETPSLDKKLSYYRGTARCVMSVEILPVATQQCRNYLYDKSWTKYQLSLIDPCDKIVL